jgi:hypothetical protein
MKRSQWVILLVSTISAGTAAVGCKAGGVGDPCIPEDEYTATFSGFGVAEANVESRSFQCETRVCIANHFQGRVSCPYGQPDPEVNADPPQGRCYVPSSSDLVERPVAAQLMERRAEATVYCSCRCEGPDAKANYCECPSGYTCAPLVPDLGLGQAQLVGKYCLKNNTEFSGQTKSSITCSGSECPSDGAASADKNPGP